MPLNTCYAAMIVGPGKTLSLFAMSAEWIYRVTACDIGRGGSNNAGDCKGGSGFDEYIKCCLSDGPKLGWTAMRRNCGPRPSYDLGTEEKLSRVLPVVIVGIEATVEVPFSLLLGLGVSLDLPTNIITTLAFSLESQQRPRTRSEHSQLCFPMLQ